MSDTTTNDLPSDASMADRVRHSPLDYGSLVLVAAAAMLLLAGVLYAFALADARNDEATERFRLLAQAATPFVAGLSLTAIALVVHERRKGGEPAQVATSVTLGLGAAVSLVTVLLAANGVVVDLTASAAAMFKLSSVVGRLATIALAGFALWLSATTPLHRTTSR
ncbi:MAG TPA: hypothetical protein VM345_03955 [Acidimicrobiales bacterium]|nr:hypothetical protein [Acidimicrobiales bacterium]